MGFLDEVAESERRREREVRRQTREGVEGFRRRREELEKAAAVQGGLGPEEQQPNAWAVKARKRKKGSEREVLGGVVKIRRTSSAAADDAEVPEESAPAVERKLSPSAAKSQPVTVTAASAAVPSTPLAPSRALQSRPVTATATDAVVDSGPARAAPAATLGLMAYSSDEDE